MHWSGSRQHILADAYRRLRRIRRARDAVEHNGFGKVLAPPVSMPQQVLVNEDSSTDVCSGDSATETCCSEGSVGFMQLIIAGSQKGILKERQLDGDDLDEA